MLLRVVVMLAAGLALGTAERAQAQFSSDLAAVPRASLPERGPYQGRMTWDFASFRTDTPAGRSTAGRAHLGFGLSRRIGRWVEVGGDMAMLDVYYARIPVDSLVGPEPGLQTRASAEGRFTASMFYAPRLGLKVRPVSLTAPDGNRIDLAVGVAYQPSLRPVIAVLHKGDSTAVSGVFGETHPELNPVHGAVQVALMGSYRADRVVADLALVNQSTFRDEGSPLESFEGFAPVLGARVRVVSFAWAGFSWWTTGAPPWRDRVVANVPEESRRHFAPVLSIGTRPERSTDLILSSPDGGLNRSVRLHIQSRWTY
jgi:hypothetical protein